MVKRLIEKISDYTHIAGMLYMLAIMFYTLFMNNETVFRDLFFFSSTFIIIGILFLSRYHLSFLRKQKIIYFFASIFAFSFLILIYAIYMIGGVDEYFNNIVSEKLGAVAGFLIFFLLLFIFLITKKR